MNKSKSEEVAREELFQRYLNYHSAESAIPSPRENTESKPTVIKDSELRILVEGIASETGLTPRAAKSSPNVFYLENECGEGIRIKRKVKDECISIKPYNDKFSKDVRDALVSKQVAHRNNFKAHKGFCLDESIRRGVGVWIVAKKDFETVKKEMGLDELR